MVCAHASIQTPYARQKVETQQQREVGGSKSEPCVGFVRVKRRLRTMIKRIFADAATSISAADWWGRSVGFAVTDVYAACDW